MAELWVDAKTGNDDNPGTKDKPMLTPKIAIGKLGADGGMVHLRGIFKSGLKFKKACYTQPLVVDGHGQTLIYAFEGKVEEFDPSNPPPRTWNNLEFTDSHNIVVKNMEVWGGINQAVGINDSYPEIGVKNITLDNITVKYGAPRGIFMGGNVIDGITIQNCKVLETIYGDTTHGIYFSGGHWDGQYPPIKNIKVINTYVAYTGGRHCIQFNGRFEDIEVHNCLIKHGQLSGLSLIGVKNAHIHNNEIWGSNRQGIVMYDYIDEHYWGMATPQEKEAWKACHHPNQNIFIYNNTILVGPKQWRKDQWHNDNPYNQPCILINNEVQNTIPDYLNSNIAIARNILWSPWCPVLRFDNLSEAHCTYVKENIVWTHDINNPWNTPFVAVPYGNKGYSFPWLEENAPNNYSDNMVVDPKFTTLPEYDFIDQCVYPQYNWKDHTSKSKLYSLIGEEKEVGVKYDMGVK